MMNNYEHTTLYGGFDNVRENNSKYALNETLKEVRGRFEDDDRERFDLFGIQTIKLRLSIYEYYY